MKQEKKQKKERRGKKLKQVNIMEGKLTHKITK